MSGRGFGAIFGFVAGAIIGGPPGAIIGFISGFAAGSMAERASTLQMPGKPITNELDVTPAKEGVPIQDIVGTVKCVGEIVHHFGERVEKTWISQSGGKGGGGDQDIPGDPQYYLSWVTILGIGPVDELYEIYDSQVKIWTGNKRLTDYPSGWDSFTVDAPSLTGEIRFYFGTATQPQDSQYAGVFGDPTLIPAYRNQCYAFFNNCCLGSANRVPNLTFVIRKTPVLGFAGGELVNTYDYNPVHAIYYVLTVMRGMPATYIDTASFVSVAATLGSSEGFGVDFCMRSYEQSFTIVENILRHIRGLLILNAEGKFEIRLLRGDEDADEMPHFDEDDFLDMPSFKRPSWNSVVNQMKVTYPERVII